MKALLTYLAILALYLYSINERRKLGKSLDLQQHNPIAKVMSQFKLFFFTGWTFVLQITFLSLAVLHEISQVANLSVNIQKRLGRARAILFNSLVAPSSLLVTSVFWTIWFIDRELIFPKAVDMFFPVWLNHVLHTFILIPVAIELMLPKQYHFVKFEKAVKVLLVYSLVYQTLFVSVYFRHGIWLYPVYKDMTWLQRIVFMVALGLVSVIYQRIAIEIQNRKMPKLQAKTK